MNYGQSALQTWPKKKQLPAETFPFACEIRGVCVICRRAVSRIRPDVSQLLPSIAQHSRTQISWVFCDLLRHRISVDLGAQNLFVILTQKFSNKYWASKQKSKRAANKPRRTFSGGVAEWQDTHMHMFENKIEFTKISRVFIGRQSTNFLFVGSQ